jgi:hypothetical protein
VILPLDDAVVLCRKASRPRAGWARTFEGVKGPDQFAALFAPEGVFCDPVTPWTTDVRKVASDTDQIFPDWQQRVDTIRGGDDWAKATATFPQEGSGPAICLLTVTSPDTTVKASRHCSRRKVCVSIPVSSGR